MVEEKPTNLINFFKDQDVRNKAIEAWMENRVSDALSRQAIDEERAEKLNNQLQEPNFRRLVTDVLVATPAIELYSICWYLGYIPLWKLVQGDPHIMLPATAAVFLPTTTYSLARATQEAIEQRSFDPFKKRAFGMSFSWIKGFGLLSLPVQAASYYPDLGLIMSYEAAVKISNPISKIPKIGKPVAQKIVESSTWVVEKTAQPGFIKELGINYLESFGRYSMYASSI